MFIKVGPPQSSSEFMIYLNPITNWNDFSFETSFLLYYSYGGNVVKVGEVKIGFNGQEKFIHTYKGLDKEFECLNNEYFSLGQSPEYYSTLEKLPHECRVKLLIGLRDIVYDENIFEEVTDESVFVDSLSRYVSISSVMQFRDILQSGVSLRNFGFRVNYDNGVSPDFIVEPNSKPPKNVHVIIGRNGVGKSHLLRTIVENIDKSNYVVTKINGEPVSVYDFGLLLYFSLSVFDKPFENVDFNEVRFSTTQTKKKYIGLYKQDNGELKDINNDLANDFSKSLYNCIYGSEIKKAVWIRIIESLEVDVNFKDLGLSNLINVSQEEFTHESTAIFKLLSSGHAAVIYYITHVIELIENKTICIFDEPENHLHPPLLSAFIRTLSAILKENNGMAVIATHSPVVLQETPKACIWKMFRSGEIEAEFQRPTIETFGEGVGEITSEVFNLDMRKSGFYSLLEEDSKKYRSAGEVFDAYSNQIGLEGRAVVYSAMKNKG
ncbi:AAA family ATPase [Cronobacter turicensis]|uniref:AAA family ATPase n=1 Tax=Cronobacter turicensis TaxID=413502 RepID=UPI001413556D|nr:AAA family ATPase [Cronobacter turicensis]NHV10346.1 AAA family ATPase [Cronobacter turicensis]NHV64119.1 AAA family ATPase [Cronobacter turicensis]NHW10531.1 AAA family ATPase [Cronobacter turicensis]